MMVLRGMMAPPPALLAILVPALLCFSPWGGSRSIVVVDGSFIPSSSRRRTITRGNQVLFSIVDPGRNKKVGGGIIPVPPGDMTLFDPNKDGKLQGTNELQSRITLGSEYSPPTSSSSNGATAVAATSPPPAAAGGIQKMEMAQHWLEDIGLPLNYAKPTSPTSATILGSTKIIGDTAPGDIRHVVMKLPNDMHYVEGQSISVIPPGLDAKGKPNKPRLYSIASTRYGDLLDGNTVSLCVRRAEYYDPITNLPDPTKKGVCSNFLCDAPKGTVVTIAGPVGKTMLLPENPKTDIIMVATGTGIAPFRAFLHRLFMEQTVTRHMFAGTAWLVLGVPTTSGLLYDEEFKAMHRNAAPGAFKLDYAISREMQNESGGKLYVQDVIAQNADDIFEKLDKGANMYFCGLKKMMPPILETLEEVATSKGMDWNTKMKELKANHQWHVEVY